MTHDGLSKLANFLTSIGLAVIIGGMLALGLIAAPTVFHTLARAEAAPLMTHIFLSFDKVLIFALVAIAVGELLRWMKKDSAVTTQAKIRGALTLVLVLSMVCSVFVLHPRINAHLKNGVVSGVGKDGKDLADLHKSAEGMYRWEMLLAVGIFLVLA